MTDNQIHASCVAVGGIGVLFHGPSGTGKSAMAIDLIACGACLVADDLTRLRLIDGHPHVLAPPRLRGVVEARGVGLLKVGHVASAPLGLVVEMGHDETERLPQTRVIEVLGVNIPLIYRVAAPYFAAAVFLLAKGGRYA